LVTTARNRAIDRIRRGRTLAAKTRLLDVPQAMEDELDETAIPDERLELMFTCCHPALALDAQVALTLRTLGGLGTAEIARAFLVPEAHGLLALMLINDARREARVADGTVVLLSDQDRSLWDADQIAEGRAALARALALGGRGAHVLQAAIAALHVDEPQDWPQLA